MDSCYEYLHTTDRIRSHEDYRINDDGFLLKFVPASDLQPVSRELIKGMYVPREYMHFLLGPNGPKGPRGGPRITFDDVPRYLTNSEFSTMLAVDGLEPGPFDVKTFARWRNNRTKCTEP